MSTGYDAWHCYSEVCVSFLQSENVVVSDDYSYQSYVDDIKFADNVGGRVCEHVPLLQPDIRRKASGRRRLSETDVKSIKLYSGRESVS